MHYDELEIEIRSTGKDSFTARVIRAPVEERPEVAFGPPLERPEVEALLRSLSGKSTKTKAPDLVASGRALYRAIFQGPLDELRGHCETLVAHRKPAQGLRLRLRFDLNDPASDYLAALPWELLRNPVDDARLAVHITTPLVRDVSRSEPRPTVEVSLPLRVLVADATNLLETERLREAFAERIEAGEVELLHLRQPTIANLRAALRDEGIHILHFIGHGGFDEDTGFGGLFFETEQKRDHQVGAETFADLLCDIETLRLVVLNACEGARYGIKTGAPYFGVAACVLERTHIPAVIAHQHSIFIDVANRFTELLYGRIAANDPIDVAMAETRLLLSENPQWATPVLFMSSPDGRLFEADLPKPNPRRRIVTVIDSRRGGAERPPLHLGIVSFLGEQGKAFGEDIRRDADRTLNLTDLFDPHSHQGRYIRDPALWNREVFPRLRSFLMHFGGGGRRILLDFAAHLSIAFAAGYVFEAKSGLDIRIRQRGQRSVLDWSPDDGRMPEPPAMQEGAPRLWLPLTEVKRGRSYGRPDRALAVSISNPHTAEEAKYFVDGAKLPIGRILDASIAPRPGHGSLTGGTHALQAAQDLIPWTRLRRPGEERGRLHLFLNCPNAFAFYLGQLSRSLGHLVLYEYPYGEADSYGKYLKSMELPPPEEPPEPPVE